MCLRRLTVSPNRRLLWAIAAVNHRLLTDRLLTGRCIGLTRMLLRLFSLTNLRSLGRSTVTYHLLRRLNIHLQLIYH